MIYRLLAWLCTGLAGLGLFLPLLPTTPFLLVAAWAASRGSPRFHFWLHSHPRFGPLIAGWQRERVIPRQALWSALAMLTLSWTILALLGMPPAVLAGLAVLFGALAFYLWSRVPDRAVEKQGRGSG